MIYIKLSFRFQILVNEHIIDMSIICIFAMVAVTFGKRACIMFDVKL